MVYYGKALEATERMRDFPEKYNEAEIEENLSLIYGSIAACREMLENSQPDVLLLDVSFPNGDSGIDFCPESANAFPTLKF